MPSPPSLRCLIHQQSLSTPFHSPTPKFFGRLKPKWLAYEINKLLRKSISLFLFGHHSGHHGPLACIEMDDSSMEYVYEEIDSKDPTKNTEPPMDKSKSNNLGCLKMKTTKTAVPNVYHPDFSIGQQEGSGYEEPDRESGSKLNESFDRIRQVSDECVTWVRGTLASVYHHLNRPFKRRLFPRNRSVDGFQPASGGEVCAEVDEDDFYMYPKIDTQQEINDNDDNKLTKRNLWNLLKEFVIRNAKNRTDESCIQAWESTSHEDNDCSPKRGFEQPRRGKKATNAYNGECADSRTNKSLKHVVPSVDMSMDDVYENSDLDHEIFRPSVEFTKNCKSRDTKSDDAQEIRQLGLVAASGDEYEELKNDEQHFPHVKTGQSQHETGGRNVEVTKSQRQEDDVYENFKDEHGTESLLESPLKLKSSHRRMEVSSKAAQSNRRKILDFMSPRKSESRENRPLKMTPPNMASMKSAKKPARYSDPKNQPEGISRFEEEEYDQLEDEESITRSHEQSHDGVCRLQHRSKEFAERPPGRIYEPDAKDDLTFSHHDFCPEDVYDDIKSSCINIDDYDGDTTRCPISGINKALMASSSAKTAVEKRKTNTDETKSPAMMSERFETGTEFNKKSKITKSAFKEEGFYDNLVKQEKRTQISKVIVLAASTEIDEGVYEDLVDNSKHETQLPMLPDKSLRELHPTKPTSQRHPTTADANQSRYFSKRDSLPKHSAKISKLSAFVGLPKKSLSRDKKKTGETENPGRLSGAGTKIRTSNSSVGPQRRKYHPLPPQPIQRSSASALPKLPIQQHNDVAFGALVRGQLTPKPDATANELSPICPPKMKQLHKQHNAKRHVIDEEKCRPPTPPLNYRTPATSPPSSEIGPSQSRDNQQVFMKAVRTKKPRKLRRSNSLPDIAKECGSESSADEIQYCEKTSLCKPTIKKNELTEEIPIANESEPKVPITETARVPETQDLESRGNTRVGEEEEDIDGEKSNERQNIDKTCLTSKELEYTSVDTEAPAAQGMERTTPEGQMNSSHMGPPPVIPPRPEFIPSYIRPTTDQQVKRAEAKRSIIPHSYAKTELPQSSSTPVKNEQLVVPPHQEEQSVLTSSSEESATSVKNSIITQREEKKELLQSSYESFKKQTNGIQPQPEEMEQLPRRSTKSAQAGKMSYKSQVGGNEKLPKSSVQHPKTLNNSTKPQREVHGATLQSAVTAVCREQVSEAIECENDIYMYLEDFH